MRSSVLRLLREAMRTGDLVEETDAEYLADALLAPFDVGLYYHQRQVLDLSVKRISAGLLSLVPR